MKFLFWNTHRNAEIDQAICDIVWENEIAIIVLAEYVGNIDNLIKRLAANEVFMDRYNSIGCDKVTILGSVADVRPGTQSNRYSIQIINNEYLLCAMHLPSPFHAGEEDRAIVVQHIVEDIERHEATLGTKETILVGDFNEDPYESGCLSARHFHALPSKLDASKESRVVEGQKFSMFYNPMWNFFGDFSIPPGTYYHTNSQAMTPFWHIFDQVMIRPCLKDAFVENSLKIIIRAGPDSLLDGKGRPDKKYSDHLPIVFEIREETK